MGSHNPLNAELNPICHLLALLGDATIVVVSRLRDNVHWLNVPVLCFVLGLMMAHWAETCRRIFNIDYQYICCVYWLIKLMYIKNKLLDPEDDGTMLFRNVAHHSPKHTSSHLRKTRLFDSTAVRIWNEQQCMSDAYSCKTNLQSTENILEQEDEFGCEMCQETNNLLYK